MTKSRNLSQLSGDLTAEGLVPAARLENSGVTAGSYTNAAITVDEKGRITLASSGEEAGASVTVSTTPPAEPESGDLWWNSEEANLYVFYDDGDSSQWVTASRAKRGEQGLPGVVNYSAVDQSIIPNADITYDLGSATNRWRDLYLSGSTINLGGAVIKTDATSGAIALLPQPTVENPNPSGVVISPSGGISVVETTGGEIAAGAIEEASSSPTAAPVPIDITTTAPTDGQTLVWNDLGSKFIPGSAAGGSLTVYATVSQLPLSGVDAGTMAFVSGNNRLYLWNGTGWYNIALINTNPTITGGANPTYTFATDGTPIVLTLTASDPEGIPLTWSYQVTSGTLGNTATVSQSNNVFTITPSTNDADAGAFGITFTASDGVNIDTAASTFTLAFGAADPYYKQSVLLSTTSTDNGTNNTFVDSSGNNVTVTRNGNATQGAYSPFSPAGWSGFFDGTGDYLSIANNAAFNFDAGDFTIELWANFNTSATIQTFVSNYANSSTGWGFQRRSDTNALNFFYGDTVLVSRSFTPTLGQWYCLTISRQGTDLKMWVDGVQQGATVTNSTNFTSAGSLFVGTLNAAIAQPFNGYISNLRVVKGTALYTTNFTPSTTPLTAVSGTSLLTLQSNRFVDNSANNFTITRSGDTRIEPFSPFSPSTPYVTSSNGGSGYFDGTGDYLSVPYSTSAFDWWTSDYTIEAWVYPTSFTGWSYTDGGNIKPTLIGNKTYNTTEHYWGFGLDATGKVYFAYYNGASQGAGSSGTATLNAWNHIALVISGTLITVYLNGVGTVLGNLGGSIASSASVPLTIGAANNTYINGYVSGLRVVKGTAVYTENFTPPTAPPTAIANTSLLMNFTNANIYDQTGKVDAETVEDAKVSTAVVKYGDSSMYFDGTGDHVLMTPSLDYTFGTGDFTVECWVYITADTSATRGIWQNGTADTCNIQRNTSGNLQAWDGADRISTTPVSSNAWNHIAFSRASGTARIFVNGVVATSWSSSVNYTSTAGWVVGYTAGGTNRMTGYIQDFRITKGRARYTANFTPPTAQLGFNNPE